MAIDFNKISIVERFKSISEYITKIKAVLENFDYENQSTIESLNDIARRALNATVGEDGTVYVPLTSVEGLDGGAKDDYVTFRWVQAAGKWYIQNLGVSMMKIFDYLPGAAATKPARNLLWQGLSYALGATKLAPLINNLTEEQPEVLDKIAQNISKYGWSSLLYEPQSWTSSELYKYRTWIRYEILEEIYNALKVYVDFHKSEFELVKQGASTTDWTITPHLKWEKFQERLRSNLNSNVADWIISHVEKIFIDSNNASLAWRNYYGVDEYSIDDYVISGSIIVNDTMSSVYTSGSTYDNDAYFMMNLIPDYAYDYDGNVQRGMARVLSDNIDAIKSGAYKSVWYQDDSWHKVAGSISYQYGGTTLDKYPYDAFYYTAYNAAQANGSLLRKKDFRPTFDADNPSIKAVTGSRLTWRREYNSSTNELTFATDTSADWSEHMVWWQPSDYYVVSPPPYRTVLSSTDKIKIEFHNFDLETQSGYYTNGVVNIPEDIWNALVNTSDFEDFLGEINAVIKIDPDGTKWVGINGELATIISDIVNGDISDFSDEVTEAYPSSKTQNPDSEWNPDSSSIDNSCAGDTVANSPSYGGNSILIDKPHDVVIPDTTPVYGLYTIYLMSGDQIKQFAQELWNPDLDITSLNRLFNNPSDAIIALYKAFVKADKISLTPVSNMKLGNAVLNVSGYSVNNTAIQYDCGSCGVPEYFKNLNDYTEKTSVELYLPFIGTVPLSAKDVVGHTVSVKYIVNLMNGECVATVYSKSSQTGNQALIGMYQGDMGYHIPISNREYSGLVHTIASGLLGAAGLVGGVVSGNIPTAIAGAGGAVSSVARALGGNTSKTQYGGQFTGANVLFCPREPFLTIRRSVGSTADGYEKYLGITSNTIKKLSECHGYTTVQALHVQNIPDSTQTEQDMIETILKQGVILP